jgi:hypothetical protein
MKSRKKLVKAQDGIQTGPGFGDKVKLATKRISRNMTNRKAVNQLRKSAKFTDQGNKEKADAYYDKADATYGKAIDKNKAVNKFKREQGFKPGGDGTYFGINKYKKPGPIFSKAKKGGSVKTKKK